MAHEHAHCTGKSPKPAQTAQGAPVGSRGRRRETFDASPLDAVSRLAEVMALSSHEARHDEAHLDVGSDRHLRGAGRRRIPRCWFRVAANSVNALSTGGAGTGGATGTGGTGRRQDPASARPNAATASTTTATARSTTTIPSASAARQRRELVRDRHPGRQRRSPASRTASSTATRAWATTAACGSSSAIR